jgi:hypothetical protein
VLGEESAEASNWNFAPESAARGRDDNIDRGMELKDLRRFDFGNNTADRDTMSFLSLVD